MFQKIVWLTVTVLLTLMFSMVINAANPRITFTNARSEGTALYISKKVTCSEPGVPISTKDPFFFHLKLDGTIAGELEYRLFQNGTEVFNYNGVLTTQKQENQIPVPFLTDRNGGFTLKAEESACFEDMKAGVFYEISETPASNYTQIEPIGGTAAIGTLTAEGESVIFHNLYSPSLPEETDSTVLEIKKDIAIPYGYELPQTPDFTFHVKIKDKNWSGKPFTIMDTKSQKVVTSGITDDNGCFSMKGGCTARLEGIPAGADYEIAETDTEGWRSVSSTNTQGETVSPVTAVRFTNAEASFVVTKQMSNSAKTEDSFLFELKKNEEVWADAEYYLYKTSGSLLDTEKHKTDAAGKFSLYPEQAAVFTGVLPGTVYSVKEDTTPGYSQTLPENGGYFDKTVSDSVEILPFVNHYEASLSLKLSLIKIGEDKNPLSGAVFELYTDKELTPSQLLETAVSSETGIAEFGELTPGTYYVKEAVSPNGYQLLVNPLKITLAKDSIIVNDKVYNGTDESAAAYFKDTADGRTACITIYNHKGFSLPITGGKGIGLHILFSMVGAAVLSWFFQKKCSC